MISFFLLKQYWIRVIFHTEYKTKGVSALHAVNKIFTEILFSQKLHNLNAVLEPETDVCLYNGIFQDVP